MLPRPLVIGLAVLISILWATNLIVGYLYPGRSDPALNAIFAIVVGAVFALGRKGEGVSQSARRKIAQLIDPKNAGGQEETDTDGRGDQK